MTVDRVASASDIQILEFMIGKQSFGINALRIRQVIKFEEQSLSPVPGTNSCVLGTIIFQEESVPVVDLGLYLGIKCSTEVKFRIILICELNNQTNGFVIDDIRNMVRISTDEIQQRSYAPDQEGISIIGVLHRDNRQVMLLDFQDITAELFGVKIGEIEAIEEQHQLEGTIFLADDSHSIRRIISNIFESAGFNRYQLFENGNQLIAAMKKRQQEGDKSIEIAVPIVVTDLEMPGMDGIALCREVKEISPKTQVVIMSSLISSQVIDRGRQAKADDFISKEDMALLLNLVRKVS